MAMIAMRTYIKEKFPCIWSILRYIKRQQWRFGSMENKFTRIYRKHLWGGGYPESLSGSSSTLSRTNAIREELPNLMHQINVKTFLDIPCGDFNWMKEVDLNVDMYMGADVVDELIWMNNERFGSDKQKFVKLDITKSMLPQVDVIFCRDCFIHFSFSDIGRALKNIKESNSKYLMTTTFACVSRNKDIVTAFDWRPLNFQRAPFNFPVPIRMINEKSPVDGYYEKSLGLWRIADIIL